ncbi:MAPEG family protein [Dokdonella sp.]|uniref:MAPEG family protein n=1 Tax=Dokdonella sp. TaxID=2291710 RepID=UPI003C50543C
MHITGLYAALSALLIILLAFRVIARRRSARIGIGDGGDRDLAKRVRAHANAAETLPIGLILLLCLEWNQTLPWILHVFGILLLLGRLLHAFGMSGSSGVSKGRLFGMGLTLLALLGMSLLLIWQFLLGATI